MLCVRELLVIDDSLYLRIGNTDMRLSSNCVMDVLDHIQNYPKDTQIMASAVLFLCLCSQFEVRPSHILNCASNMVRKSGGYSQANFEAVKAYLKNEIGEDTDA